MTHAPDPRDPVLEFSQVLRLARRHLPSVGEVTGVDESGGEARTYAIDEGYIFKTQRPHRVRPRTSLEKEVFHLNQLAAQAPDINVPRVLGYGHEDGVEYTLMTRMPGQSLRHTDTHGEARASLLRELGTVLRRMHGLDSLPFRQSNLFPGDEDASATRERLLADLHRAVEAAGTAPDAWTLEVRPEEVGERAAEELSVIAEEPVPLHSNPGPEHVFVEPSTMRLVGIIDFGDAYLSHPALDLRRWGRARDRAAILHGYT
jgi:hygromycin-B 7''-O-kinase